MRSFCGPSRVGVDCYRVQFQEFPNPVHDNLGLGHKAFIANEHELLFQGLSAIDQPLKRVFQRADVSFAVVGAALLPMASGLGCDYISQIPH